MGSRCVHHTPVGLTSQLASVCMQVHLPLPLVGAQPMHNVTHIKVMRSRDYAIVANKSAYIRSKGKSLIGSL